MANINVVVDKPIADGYKLKFRTPCDSTAIEGLEVKYPAKNGVGTLIKKFVFKDAHGTELSGVGNLFVSGVMIEVLLDVTHSVAYIQNADTNSYVESVKGDIKRMEESQKQFLSVAGKSVEDCERAAKAIYIGDGEIPEDALVQIDPSGSVLVVDKELDKTSENLVTNKAVALGLETIKEEIAKDDALFAIEFTEYKESVAQELELKALKGYGYGETIELRMLGLADGVGADINTQLDSMTRYWRAGTASQIWIIDEGFLSASIFATVFKVDDTHTLVRGQTSNGYNVTKYKYAGVWSEWLWENPPMRAGIEYATTECYNGDVVYTKVIEYGALPSPDSNNVYGYGYKKVDHNIADFGALVSVDGVVNIAGYKYQALTAFNIIRDVGVDESGVSITTASVGENADYSTNIATVVLKYIKAAKQEVV